MIDLSKHNLNFSFNKNINNEIYKPIVKNVDPVVKDNLIDQLKNYLKIDVHTALNIYDICEKDQGFENIQNIIHIPAEEAEKKFMKLFQII